ncbi:MAG: molybdenum cofactor biosynthesis protein [Actinobacteria bacterium]|nr:molybdenum cofactor biosynthesis protein [Actinomycetota bacterium]
MKSGKASMADISGKPATAREAVAEGWVLLSAAAWRMIKGGEIPKGDVLGVARVAGIMAAKSTPRILPLCHPLPLASVAVDFSLSAPGKVRIVAVVRTVAPTGVEMEALTAVSAAALCIYDMAKPVDRSIEITGIRLLRKTGGKSGDYSGAKRGSSAPGLITRADRAKRGLAVAQREISRPSRAASRPASRNSAGGRGKAPKRSR